MTCRTLLFDTWRFVEFFSGRISVRIASMELFPFAEIPILAFKICSLLTDVGFQELFLGLAVPLCGIGRAEFEMEIMRV
jgi:hypothetical protein